MQCLKFQLFILINFDVVLKIVINFASSMKKLLCFRTNKKILVSEYSEWSTTSRNIIFLTGVRMYVCVCVYVLDFLIFKPLEFINSLRYRVEIWYSSEAVTPLQS